MYTAPSRVPNLVNKHHVNGPTDMCTHIVLFLVTYNDITHPIYQTIRVSIAVSYVPIISLILITTIQRNRRVAVSRYPG